MRLRAVFLVGVAALLALGLGLASPAAADIINFDSLSGTAYVTNGYGNTANVTVSYQVVNASGGVVTANELKLWTPSIFSHYGNLDVVGYVNSGSGQPNAEGHYGEITLTPAAGYSITFQSFDVATYEGSYGDPPTGQLLAILDQNGNPLLQYTDQTISTMTHITYSPDITSNGALTLEFGPSGNFGINNIVFTSQAAAVPLPPSLLLFGSGLLGLAGFGRRLRRQA